ncbi:site-specific integrase [Roseibium sp. AS2]|uniref:tyrosine-type recombinase/integrase n=1 Tax=Roseibium sp. AS2 TaxID=3135781 RepID=UPI0031741865
MGNMQSASSMRLYDERNQRLYINAAERARFIKAAERAAPEISTFGLTLLYTGCRISEALELTAAAVQIEAGSVSIRCLKKRRKHIMREVPIPSALADLLDAVHGIRASQQRLTAEAVPLWRHGGQPVNRSTAYRWIKDLMRDAGIRGIHASPKGLRHGYGIHAIRSGVPLNMLCKWMGHASISTTAIYTNALGPDEQEIAARMWD